ncbi:MAG: hypothetical protein M1822_007868 [Bathelium mastoideum]|nr:MAG: hypothetical protein M1822_007868 [Bathelium mastoideum]
MAKKRKASSQAHTSENREDSGLGSRLRIDTFEDVADSDDEFHLNRDQILLDELPEAKRQRLKRGAEDDTLELSDEEVLAYSPSSSENEEDEDNEALDDQDIAQQYAIAYSSQRRADNLPRDNQQTFDDDEDSDKQEEDDHLEKWGSSKQDYYDADVIETEQDALEEEAEARRLQQKRLNNMSETDYGLDEAEWSVQGPAGAEDGQLEGSGIVTETLPQFQISENMSFPERLKLLKSRYPEFEPFSKDLLNLQERHQQISQQLAQARGLNGSVKGPGSASESLFNVDAGATVIQVQYQALSLYLGALSLYFALLTSNAAENDVSTSLPLSTTELRNHEVMEELVQSRALWLKVKDMEIPEPETDQVTAVQPSASILANLTNESINESTAMDVSNSPELKKTQQPPKDQQKSDRHSAKQARAQAEATARHAERMRRVEEDLATLDDLMIVNKRLKPGKAVPEKERNSFDNDSDLGEENQISARDLADKAKRRRSLRFYTSQIAQKSNKRAAAGRDAGGDMDVPYRERLKDRQARLNVEAERRGKKKADDSTALGGESDEEDQRQAREVRDEAGGEEDYYDLVAARSKQRKQDKRDRAEAYAQAAKDGGRVVETAGEIGLDGKRAISYAIEKNKGLTQHRRKEIRNPRVKKRKKFDEKKKKLGSMKQVYKGGEGKGGYQGELTGIKKGVVKSIKL